MTYKEILQDLCDSASKAMRKKVDLSSELRVEGDISIWVVCIKVDGLAVVLELYIVSEGESMDTVETDLIRKAMQSAFNTGLTDIEKTMLDRRAGSITPTHRGN